MNDNIKNFLNKTKEAFEFLEKEYGYKLLFEGIENQSYFPDAQVTLRYIGIKIGIEIYWYFASATINVAFVKLINGIFPVSNSNEIETINLYSLADYCSKGKSDMFLLKNTTLISIPKIKEREKLINERMYEIIDNLVSGVKKYAIDILKGDISIFPKVQEYRQME